MDEAGITHGESGESWAGELCLVVMNDTIKAFEWTRSDQKLF